MLWGCFILRTEWCDSPCQMFSWIVRELKCQWFSNWERDQRWSVFKIQWSITITKQECSDAKEAFDIYSDSETICQLWARPLLCLHVKTKCSLCTGEIHLACFVASFPKMNFHFSKLGVTEEVWEPPGMLWLTRHETPWQKLRLGFCTQLGYFLYSNKKLDHKKWTSLLVSNKHLW